MAKTIINKVRKPLSPKPAAKQAKKAYPVEQEDLDEQQPQLREAVAPRADGLKSPAPTAAEGYLAAPPTIPAKPLAPIAALWPDPLPPKAGSRPSQGTLPQKAPVTAIAPKPSPHATAPLSPPPVQSAPPKATENPSVAASTAKPTAPKTPGVRFALHKPDANQVSLCGDFNGWTPSATPMKRLDDGHWETTVALAPGCFHYKFVADGDWLLDPAAQKNVPNEFGSLNSVVEVRP